MRLILVMATAALALVPPSVQLAALRRGERLASTPSSAKPPRTRLASAPTPSTKPKPKNRGKKKPQKKKRGARPRGSVANVHWRAIPARALRSHPAYLGLPPSQSVCGDADLARAALFRQDTWRWDALHAGRLTGSRVAAVCGLLEASAAETLRIPKSLASHGRALRAAMHLRERLDASLLEAVFRDEEHDDDEDAGEWRENDASPFAYDWMGAPDTGGRRCGDPMAARLSWGKTQEGIGMLAAVNHVRGSVAELGLLCAETPGAVDCLAESWPVKPRTTAPSPRRCPVGASPDGLIVYADGALDVLEVKSVAPFVRGSGNATMELYDRGPHDNLASWIVPQVMLEIYAAGASGAILVSTSATRGAIIMRVPRDDAYIESMLGFVDSFYERYCDPAAPLEPEPCFNGGADFDAFVKRTGEIAREATLVERVPNLQRAPPGDKFFLDYMGL